MKTPSNLLIQWMVKAYHPSRTKIRLADYPDLNWEFICSEAQKTGMNSRLLEFFPYSQFAEQIEVKLYENLVSARIAAIHRNLLLMEDYQNISKLLHQHQIPHTAIKGLWILSHPEFQGLSRITSDIDLLVHPDRIEAAVHLIRHLGFAQDPGPRKASLERAKLTGHHLRPFRKGSCTVELHHRAFPGSSDSFTQALILRNPIADHYVVLLSHLVRHLLHNDPQIKWLADLFRITSFLQDQDGQRILGSISNHSLSPMEQECFELFLKWSKSQDPASLGSEFCNLWMRVKRQGNGRTAARGPLSFRWEMIGSSLFPCVNYLRFIYPGFVKLPVPLLYLLRWYKLGRRIGILALKSLKF